MYQKTGTLKIPSIETKFVLIEKHPFYDIIQYQFL